MERCLVSGAGGFIGHHLVNYLKDKGYWVFGVDLKEPEYEGTHADEFLLLDLREKENCYDACKGMDHVYHLAADMGGIGYITEQHATIALNDLRINTNMIQAAVDQHVERFFYSSSACVYPQHLQDVPENLGLKELDAWPADPEPGYGLEKLVTEKLCQYVNEDYGMVTRVARFHNVYGPLGTWEGGKEKAPAAICRKVARASEEKNANHLEVWGDGEQTRSFMDVRDCVEGIYRIMQSEYPLPLNLGRAEMISIDELVRLVIKISGKDLEIRHNLKRPQGVRGRNSDNRLCRKVLKWQPVITLEKGMTELYQWVASQIDL